MKSLLVSLIILASWVTAAAQAKTVTNADLEKFRLRRLQAERDLREFYKRIGLTPEEVAKREAENAKEREALSLALRRQRLEREQAEAPAQIIVIPQYSFLVPQPPAFNFSSYFLYGNRLYPNPKIWTRPFGSSIQWRATPFEIIYEPGNYSSNVWPPPRINANAPRRPR